MLVKVQDIGGFKKDFVLKNVKPSDLITFYNSEFDKKGFYGFGLITGIQIPGKCENHIWLDGDYYGLVPFKMIEKTIMSIDTIRKIYGDKWNSLFCINSNKMPQAKLTDEELGKFIEYMIKRK